MNAISILIIVLIVFVSIFVLTYIAHHRDETMCSGCHGDCTECKKKNNSEKETL